MLPLAQLRERLRFAVEDRFLILNFWEKSALLPAGYIATAIAHIFGALTPRYSLVCDMTKVEGLTFENGVTNDMVDFLYEFRRFDPTILVRDSDATYLRWALTATGMKWASNKILPMRHRPPRLNLYDFPPLPDPVGPGYQVRAEALPQWRTAIKEIDTVSPPSKMEHEMISDLFCTVNDVEDSAQEEDEDGRPYLTYQAMVEDWGKPNTFFLEGYEDVMFAMRWLAAKIPFIGRNSLLSHFAFEIAGGDVVTTPYHGHAVYPVETRSGLLLGRPLVLARKTGTLFSSEIEQFSVLLSSRPREIDIQRFLEKNPRFLRSLGYQHLYPQVIMTRDDGTTLRPDFILQPFGEEWCDILDIKLPSGSMVVGRRDRRTLAAGIHELAAQLREYAAHFDNPKYAKRIEEKYGFKCYRPRLIGVVGRTPDDTDDRQIRRLLTSYQDIEFVTFDRLINIARSRLLI